jgi:PAS domain-containing protein
MPMMDDLEDLLQAVGSPAYFFDRTSHEILAVNSHFARLMEYDEAKLPTMTVADLRPAEDIDKPTQVLAQSPPEGAVEWRYKTRSGTIYYVQLNYRNSVFLDKQVQRRREVRLVVISKWDIHPMRATDEHFGNAAGM